jgi:UPF0271 protein
MLVLDINCDMGEGLANETELMPYVSSANIACGFHAGDADSMKRVVDLCLQHGVAIGAHPSYPDRPGFGRRDLVGAGLQAKDVFDIVTEQLVKLQGIVVAQGGVMHHVKPHGALYNRVAWDVESGFFVVKAIYDFHPDLVLYGLSGSPLSEVAQSFSVSFVHEVFADRTYTAAGSLTPRSESNALIEDVDMAGAQVLGVLQRGEVVAATGEHIPIKAQTVCIHGDGRNAVPLAKKLHSLLLDRGTVINDTIEK